MGVTMRVIIAGGPGTADVIKQAEGKGLKVRVVNCKT